MGDPTWLGPPPDGPVSLRNLPQSSCFAAEGREVWEGARLNLSPPPAPHRACAPAGQAGPPRAGSTRGIQPQRPPILLLWVHWGETLGQRKSALEGAPREQPGQDRGVWEGPRNPEEPQRGKDPPHFQY